jgi:hypothetical protein
MRVVSFVGFALLLFDAAAIGASMSADPGAVSRAQLRPAAKEALALADQRRAAGDPGGALRAYIAAVDADPAAADLALIRRLGIGHNVLITYRDPVLAAKMLEQPERPTESYVAALRQYLALHPDHRDAVAEVVPFLDEYEAEALLTGALKKHPGDAVLYAMRGKVHRDAGESKSRWPTTRDRHPSTRRTLNRSPSSPSSPPAPRFMTTYLSTRNEPFSTGR